MSVGSPARHDVGLLMALDGNGIYRCIIKLHVSIDTFSVTEAAGKMLMNISLIGIRLSV